MRVKVTRQARQFVLTGQRDDLGDVHRYYIARQRVGRLMIIVCRNGLDLDELAGAVVDASLGWEQGTLGFVHDQDVGVPHTKLTIYRVSSGRQDKSLARIMSDAPQRRMNND